MQQHVKHKPPAYGTHGKHCRHPRDRVNGCFPALVLFGTSTILPIAAQVTAAISLHLCPGVGGGWVGWGYADGGGAGPATNTSSPYLMLQAGQLRTGFFLQHQLAQSQHRSLVLRTQLFISQTLLQHCNSEAVEGSGLFCPWLWSPGAPLQRGRATLPCHDWILSGAGRSPSSREDATDSETSSLNAHQFISLLVCPS